MAELTNLRNCLDDLVGRISGTTDFEESLVTMMYAIIIEMERLTKKITEDK